MIWKKKVFFCFFVFSASVLSWDVLVIHHLAEKQCFPVSFTTELRLRAQSMIQFLWEVLLIDILGFSEGLCSHCVHAGVLSPWKAQTQSVHPCQTLLSVLWFCHHLILQCWSVTEDHPCFCIMNTNESLN